MTKKSAPRIFMRAETKIFTSNFDRLLFKNMEVLFGENNVGMSAVIRWKELGERNLIFCEGSSDAVALRNKTAHGDIDVFVVHGDDDHHRLYDEIKAAVELRSKSKEPATVIYLLELCCATSSREAIVGDLLEQYHEAIELYGPTKAKVLLWRRAIGSIASLTWGTCRRFAFVTIFFQVVDWFRKLGS